jgi:hypothetical protein
VQIPKANAREELLRHEWRIARALAAADCGPVVFDLVSLTAPFPSAQRLSRPRSRAAAAEPRPPLAQRWPW